MTRARRRPVRHVREPLREVACPGCGRNVRLRGRLELIPPHTVPEPPFYGPPEERPAPTPRPACRWAHEPVPGRPDGTVSRAEAGRTVVRQQAERDRQARRVA